MEIKRKTILNDEQYNNIINGVLIFWTLAI